MVDQLIRIVEKRSQTIGDMEDVSAPLQDDASARLTQTLERGEILLQLGLYSDLSESVAPVLELLPQSVRSRALLSESALDTL